MPVPFATITVSPVLVTGPPGPPGPVDHSYTDAKATALQDQIDLLSAQLAAVQAGGSGGTYGLLDFTLTANSGLAAAIGA